MAASMTPIPFTRYEKLVIALLAFLQFTIILDFMILSPLGATILPSLDITPSQFGLVVSAYAFSAGLSGILAAGFADRFDRKKLLLFFYVGFLFGTLLCGLVTTYAWLLVARTVTGLFGGVIGSVTLAIATDLFPLEQRGRVMGIIQTAFSASQILGIPVGLYFGNLWGWHAPFLVIVVIGAAVGAIIFTKLKPVDAHLKLAHGDSAFRHLLKTVTHRPYLLAFATTALLSTGGFMLMPFGSAFTVYNLGLTIDQLPLIYLITGLSTMAAGPLVGRAADRFGKLKTFAFGTAVSAVTVVIYTNLGVTPLWGVLLINVAMFIGVFSRMIPAQALMSAIPDPSTRGSFSAVSSSIQQVSGGVASVIAGVLIAQKPGQPLEHFDRLGYVVLVTGLVALALMYRISARVTKSN